VSFFRFLWRGISDCANLLYKTAGNLSGHGAEKRCDMAACDYKPSLSINDRVGKLNCERRAINLHYQVGFSFFLSDSHSQFLKSLSLVQGVFKRLAFQISRVRMNKDDSRGSKNRRRV